jgi:hypothetical protein
LNSHDLYNGHMEEQVLLTLPLTDKETQFRGWGGMLRSHCYKQPKRGSNPDLLS